MVKRRPELLAPAGDAERLEAALFYGADAVYLGGKLFNMRAATESFDDEALKSAPLTVDAYKDSTWKSANAVNQRQQPGDPMKAGELVYRMAYAEEAPFRLLLGSDAVKAVLFTAEARIEETNRFAEDSRSTDF